LYIIKKCLFINVYVIQILVSLACLLKSLQRQQGSHYFEIRGRSDFSFRCWQKRSESTGRSQNIYLFFYGFLPCDLKISPPKDGIYFPSNQILLLFHIHNLCLILLSCRTIKYKGMDSPVTMYMEEHDGATEKRDRRRSRALELKQTVGSPLDIFHMIFCKLVFNIWWFYFQFVTRLLPCYNETEPHYGRPLFHIYLFNLQYQQVVSVEKHKINIQISTIAFSGQSKCTIFCFSIYSFSNGYQND
jgi:hypothetical protein